MLPGVDDGCEDIEQSIRCIEMLKQAGYVGTICTPHVWAEPYPLNRPDHIAGWVAALANQLADRGIEYQLWPGAEMRLAPDSIDRFKAEGVQTLAASNLVLFDFWEPRWPKWADATIDWLLAEGYQPLLAHPERLPMREGVVDALQQRVERGLLLQGNFRCFTGEEGYLPDQHVRTLQQEGLYTFLAMDMHRPSTLPGRLDGLDLFIKENSADQLDQYTIDAPRKHIFN